MKRLLKKLNQPLMWLVFVFASLTLLIINTRRINMGVKKLEFENGKTIQVEIADSLMKRTQGLSGRESMDKNRGMLFVFDSPNRVMFHMKEMNFPLDFVFIRDNKILEVRENVPADINEIIRPEAEVDGVLEINAGLIEELEIKVGQKVILKDF